MENTEKKSFNGWSVELTKDWPFIRFNPFEDKEPTINKKPIPFLSKNGKISEQPKPAAKPRTPKQPKPKVEQPKPVVETTPTPEEKQIRIIEYSEKGIAVVGDIDLIRDKLIAAYGSPKTFTHDGQRYQGIAFSKKRRDQVIKLIAG